MWGKKNGCRSKGLCPVSFGLALGITAFLAMIIWAAWLIIHGVPPVAAVPEPGSTATAMMLHHEFPVTWGAAFAYALLAFVKGFVFGFILILLYDGFACCCRSSCCRKDGSCCGCGCKSCDTEDMSKPGVDLRR